MAAVAAGAVMRRSMGGRTYPSPVVIATSR